MTVGVPGQRDGSASAGATARGGQPPEVRIEGLTIAYRTDAGELPAVSNVTLRLPAGTITGLVGESGSGKSTLALAMLGAVQRPGRITGGSVHVEDVGDVTTLDRRALRRARGAKIGYVFQAAQNSLNPLKPIGKQLLDLGKAHDVKDVAGLVEQARRLLSRMGLDADRVLRSYQHELSGGMRQRVGIMLALVLNAHLVVLDEPTTALDMITQSNILQIVRDVHAERGLTTLVVTHDVGVTAEVADRLAVMYGGRVVEHGTTSEVLGTPLHPYTRGLINAIPRLTGDIDEARPLPGRPPTLGTIPTVGCVFRERCPLRMPVCAEVDPPFVVHGERTVACHAVERFAADRADASVADLSAAVAEHARPVEAAVAPRDAVDAPAEASVGAADALAAAAPADTPDHAEEQA